MKSLILAALGLLSAAAVDAATIQLPLPTIASLNPNIPATCTWTQYATPHTFATGFDSTGNYVLGEANDVAVCGHSGRGSNLQYYPYCASFVWDLSGTLVNVINGVCPAPKNTGARYFNGAGYEEETFYQLYFGYIQYEYPELITP